ncbi:MAG: hypothetical protein GEU90_09395 [Gemmatimonas sp.]|nr:hypothetical protein [Gemmatimonas sp.]
MVERVEERLRWARRQGHPFYVWPDVRLEDWRKALVEIERVTRAVLAGRGTRTTMAGGDDASLAALDVAAFTSCMGPLLGWWVEQGMLLTSDRVRERLALHLEHGRRRDLRMLDALRETVRTLDAAGVAVTALKGAHTARTCFPAPGLRPMADLDLLVPASEVSRAELALRAAGYSLVPGSRRTHAYYRSNWQSPNAPTTLRSFEMHHEDNPYNVDLHNALDVDFYGVRTVRFDVPADMLVAAPWAGERATALAQPLLTAHLAVHASRGLYNLMLVRLVELAFLLRRDAGRSYTWDDLSALLHRYRAERFSYPTFELLERLTPGAIDPAFRERLARAATPAQRRVIDRVTPATAQCLDRLTLDDRFMWAATPVEYVRRATHMLLPAGVGGSLGRVCRSYVVRAFRILRGRVAWRG